MAKSKRPAFSFPSLREKAAAYAQFKYLERCLKDDGELPPGYQLDCSGMTVTMVLPPGTIVSRSLGSDGKGHDFHTASQNLNGFAVLALTIYVLRKFNQAKWITWAILDAIKAAVKTKTLSTEDKMIQQDTLTLQQVEEFREELQQVLPKRQQDTVRDMLYSDLPPTITWYLSKAA